MDASIGSQHQRDDGRPEQHVPVRRLRVEAHASLRRTAVLVTIGQDDVTEVLDQPLFGRANSSVAQAELSVGGGSAQ